MKRILLAIGYGVLAALAAYLVGILVQSVMQEAGNFIMWAAPVVGLIAGGWYFLAGRRPL